MSKPFTPKVITANHLLSGDVIYFTAENSWSVSHADAVLMTEKDTAQHQLSKAALDTRIAVDPYLADARLNADGNPEPTHFREIFRSKGPSNYPHGKHC